jgi:hypothetical protein
MGREGFLSRRNSSMKCPPALPTMTDAPGLAEGGRPPAGFGGRPLAPESEEKIVQILVAELNSLYDLGLGAEPCRLREAEISQKKVKLLVIGGSHAERESQVLVDRGYEVFTCAVGGWRPNKMAADEMAS